MKNKLTFFIFRTEFNWWYFLNKDDVHFYKSLDRKEYNDKYINTHNKILDYEE